MPSRLIWINVALALLLNWGPLRPSQPACLKISRGTAISVDGKLATGEWDDAKLLVVHAGPGWPVRVLYKHDGAHLLFAFEGVTRKHKGKDEYRFPELLLDPKNLKTPTWQHGQWWLHASANECEGNGEFAVCSKDGKFLGSKEKPGWKANNHPYGNPPVVEVAISFEKIGVGMDGKKVIGLALNLTNTSDAYYFWPDEAKLEQPSTWGEAVILP